MSRKRFLQKPGGLLPFCHRLEAFGRQAVHGSVYPVTYGQDILIFRKDKVILPAGHTVAIRQVIFSGYYIPYPHEKVEIYVSIGDEDDTVPVSYGIIHDVIKKFRINVIGNRRIHGCLFY